ncbi:MAG: hypothetical protein JSW24_00545 [Dehalococcoidia bacterium]|nr:MAG: hypothetical protein JSW24_00545 [Dehalococcoidia bacterium]
MSKKLIAAIVMLTLGIVFFGVSWGFTQQDLDFTRTELSNTRLALDNNKRELLDTKDELSITTAELQDTKSYLSDIETELQVTRDNLSTVETELEETIAELEETMAELSNLQADPFYLHNPTFEEVISFLSEDKTDRNRYIEDEYVCSHFARDVSNNAETQGIRCAFVDIRFPLSAHAIIAFDTTDQGMVYFDPITDERVRPIIGKQYWRCIEPEPGYYYEKPSFDDTILDIVVIW